MYISIVTSCRPCADEGIVIDLDIDRWESDGGKGLDPKHESGPD